MTTRRDMTQYEFELALQHQHFIRGACHGSIHYRSTATGTDLSYRYTAYRYRPPNRRLTIKILIEDRQFHEKKLRLADPYSLKNF